MITLLLTYFLLMIFFLLEVFMRSSTTAKNTNQTKSDNWSTYLIGLTFFIVLVVSIILNLFKLGTFHNSRMAWLGLLLMLIGLFIRVYSMMILGKYYTRTLILTDDQQLVKKGLYKYIRHPGYLGTILIWCAAGLAMQNKIVFITAIALTFVAYYYRINNEEKMLMGKFGEEYLKYKKITWRLFPLIW